MRDAGTQGRWSHCLLALCLLLALAGGPTWAGDVGVFDHSYGQPAIGLLAPAYCYEDARPGAYPPVAMSATRVFVGGSSVSIYSRDGAWAQSWPFSSPVRHLGETSLYTEWYGEPPYSRVNDLALAPSGDVYLLDKGYGAIQRYTSEGVFVSGWDLRHEATPTSLPVSISISPDSAVYVLDVGLQSILAFSLEGVPLGQRSIDLSHDYFLWDEGRIAAAPDGGVWLMAYGSDGEQRVSYFGSDGAPGPSWLEPYALAIAVDQAGDLYVLTFSLATPHQVLRYSANGHLKAQFDAPSGTVGLTTTPESRVALLVGQVMDAEYYCPVRMYFRVEERDQSGTLIRSFGDTADMLERGTLADARTLAVTPEGDAYAKVDYDGYLYSNAAQYLADFAPDGTLAEVLPTTDVPFYNPVLGELEFSGTPPYGTIPQGVSADGQRHYYACVCNDGSWVPVASGPTGEPGAFLQWRTELTIGWTESGVRAKYPVNGPIVPVDHPAYDCVRGVAGGGPDGNLHLALSIPDQWGQQAALVWLGTYDPDGHQLSSVQTQLAAGQPTPCAISGLTLDRYLNVYLAGLLRPTSPDAYSMAGITVFSRTGRYLGWLGGWGGSADQQDAPASLLGEVRDVRIDGTGRVHVLDNQENRVFVFNPSYRFSDVQYGQWAKMEVEAAAAAGIVLGYPGGVYCPEVAVTRDAMAAFVSRALAGGDANVIATGASFPDVGPEHWAYDYVRYAKEHGIVTGYSDGFYHPERVVDRGQMSVFIARALAGGDENVPVSLSRPAFSDVTWFRNQQYLRYVQYLLDEGVVQGYPDGSYHPEIEVSRDQMAVFVARAFGLG